MIRTALVTGSTSGIGLGIAKEFARRGYNVVLNGFGDTAAALAEVRGVGGLGKIDFVGADLGVALECQKLINASQQLFSRLDVLWDRILALNLSSVFYCSQAALPFMEAQDFGRIINIASVHGLVASANKSCYVAAKHGVLGFTKAVALEYAKRNITCNAVCPGWVLTPLVQAQIDARAKETGASNADAMAALIGEKMPTGVPASVEEIALAVAYLADDRSVSTRGATLTVDGGWVSQ